MLLLLLLILGTCLAFAALIGLWFIPDATLGKGPKSMMFLFMVGFVLFLGWMVHVSLTMPRIQPPTPPLPVAPAAPGN